jgi:hypothetical protein
MRQIGKSEVGVVIGFAQDRSRLSVLVNRWLFSWHQRRSLSERAQFSFVSRSFRICFSNSVAAAAGRTLPNPPDAQFAWMLLFGMMIGYCGLNLTSTDSRVSLGAACHFHC